MAGQRATGERTAASALSPRFRKDNAAIWHDVPANFFADSASSQAGHLHALRTSVKLLELPAQLHALAQRTLIGHVRIKPPPHHQLAGAASLRPCQLAGWLAAVGTALPHARHHVANP